ncbi:copper homeostasis protein CutC [Gluconobacter wancherniae]|nr:copper homeostasis protein CutC [Gluconobacter wancherniae]
MKADRTGLEVCVGSPESLLAACKGGADRIELCAALELGGLTPSPGLIAAASALPCPAYAMIRPRGGDFVFSETEEQVMRADIAACASARFCGVVLGASLPDGRLDAVMLGRLLDYANSCGIRHTTLHRAFDLVPDPYEALETAISLGFERILTSGGHQKANDGLIVLQQLVTQASGRISIMAGSGVTPFNAAKIVGCTGVTDVHASCRGRISNSPGTSRGQALGFGARCPDTDIATVRAMRNVLDAIFINRAEHTAHSTV